MGLFGSGKKKKDDVKETIIKNSIGEDVHVFDDGTGQPVSIKLLNSEYRMPTGLQYCPYCHIQCSHRDERYWECEECNYSIDDEEVEFGDGYPTLESTYEDDYGEYYSEQSDDDEY